ncbi:hypothetical protein TNCV_2861791 [Trichonephila clavipes]|nr:hypothetical protein TNCV_2861791 [Trichonephila clavipes]
MSDKDILELAQSSKNIIETDSDDENEMNNAAPVPTSSEMRNIMKSMRSYLDQRYSTRGPHVAHRAFLSGPDMTHCSEKFTY